MNSIIHTFPIPEIKKSERNLLASANWLQKLHLTQSDQQAESIANAGAYFTGLSYPDIKPAQIQDITDFCSWVCLLDDAGEDYLIHRNLPELITFLTRLKYICEESDYQNPSDLGLFNDHPIVNSILDLKTRLRVWVEIPQLNHLMKAVGYFTSGIQWENAIKIQREYPDVNTFCVMRMASGGMDIPFALAQCVNNVQLTIKEYTHPIIQILTKSLSLAALLDNDIYSYEKEKASDSQYNNNIIQVYLNSYPDLAEEEAISKAICLRNQILLLYQVLKEKYYDLYKSISLYFKGLEDVLSGNLIFCSTNKRYKIANDQKGREFTIIQNDQQEINPPKDIPSISWWWSLLDSKQVLTN